MYENSFPDKRYELTFKFINKYISKDESILDLGVINPFSEILTREGYNVKNTKGQDFDLEPKLTENNVEVITALEILEHLVSPFPLLQNLPGKKLIATVPLRLWFKSAYRNEGDSRDRHYHEFEDWQFDWLIEKSGWKIKDCEKWIIPAKSLGIRPILRNVTPRIYAIYAER